MNIKSWIQGIGLGSPSPDELSAFDSSIDGSIGGLGTKMEKMYNSQRSVPLFEFRDLFDIPTSNIKTFMASVDSSIQALHNTYAVPPQKRKRQAAASCVMTADTFGTFSASISATPTLSCTLQNSDPDQGIAGRGCICGSTTLPLLTVPTATDPAESCAYTAIPTTTGANPITVLTSTYTSACQACTLVGGIADTPTCTAIAGCVSTTSTSTPAPAPTSTSPPPTCSPGFYGTDTSCGGTCNGASASCSCVEAGYEFFNEACTCTC